MIILGIALICTLAAIIAANKCLKGMPAQIMRGNIPKKSSKEMVRALQTNSHLNGDGFSEIFLEIKSDL